MKKTIFYSALLFSFSIFLFSCSNSSNPVTNPTSNTLTNLQKGGFDQFGYNYGARLFNGPADGVDRNLDGTVWGIPTYANDHLVMKWTADWDRGNAEGWSKPPYLSAWVDNEWNGNVPGGSGTTEHCKIIWVGADLQNSPYWRTGGYPIWGQFEVLMDQGTDPTGHWSIAHAVPNGYK